MKTNIKRTPNRWNDWYKTPKVSLNWAPSKNKNDSSVTKAGERRNGMHGTRQVG